MNIKKILENINKTKPLVHHITNYVTVNDCANVTLAIGSSPVMADAIDEASQMASIASSLVLNIGTLNADKINSMIKAGKKANSLDIPVVFDPVGCGATAFRNEMSELLIKNVNMSVIRGNLSEILALSGKSVVTKGVDSSDISIKNLNEYLKNIAEKFKTVIAVTGKVDRITDGKKIVEIYNGCKEMSNITGSGCMCSSLIGTFVGANKDNIFEATVAAILTMGIAGENAWDKYKYEGLGHFHMGIIDEISKITPETIELNGNWNEK
ncbi:MAG: hydroxyethylthiazole kinase [Dialister micraerophilus]|uniref:hydroxyethylthiazole kinase n=1 Tax=Dialister micraerophilus TaxID=309120 RepID=UPI00254C3A5C|nr:hydroxyethylthiazole kinase [Dialister micraerophilus]MDK8253565.1 hydroxyethylthiazole kinase [Dialister micraerophilus]